MDCSPEISAAPRPAEPAPSLEQANLPALRQVFDTLKHPISVPQQNKFINSIQALSVPVAEATSLVRIADQYGVTPMRALSIMSKGGANAAFVEEILASSERNIARGAKGKTAPAVILSSVADIAAMEAGYKQGDPDRDFILQLQQPEKKEEHLDTDGALRGLADHYRIYNIPLKIIKELYELRRSVDLVEEDLSIVTSAPLGTHEREGKLTQYNRVVKLIRMLEDRDTYELGNGSDLHACEVRDEERDIMTFDEAAYLLGGDFPGIPDLDGLEDDY